jgi:hypothetical protein
MRLHRTDTRRRAFALTAVAVAAVAMSACGDSAESGLEKAIEQQSGGNVDINTDDGGFSIETEDGSMTVDADGNFVITDENGETITGNADGDTGSVDVEGEDGSFSGGATTELPDEWPSDVPTPDGLTIASAFVVSDTGYDAITVSGTADGEAFLDEYGSQLEAAGFESTSEFTADGNVNRVYSSDAWTVGLNYIEDESGNQITISLSSTG